MNHLLMFPGFVEAFLPTPAFLATSFSTLLCTSTFGVSHATLCFLSSSLLWRFAFHDSSMVFLSLRRHLREPSRSEAPQNTFVTCSLLHHLVNFEDRSFNKSTSLSPVCGGICARPGGRRLSRTHPPQAPPEEAQGGRRRGTPRRRCRRRRSRRGGRCGQLHREPRRGGPGSERSGNAWRGGH
jgi:hypothetical protein